MSDDSAVNRAALIPARLRAARENAGLSQGQVAKLMNMHRPSISEIEAGNRRVSADELARLGELYDVKVAWILGEAPERVATDDPKLQLAARELSKLKPEALDQLMTLIAAMKEDDDGPKG
jgi:transcriptional regulator with XRE-family HTH domain